MNIIAPQSGTPVHMNIIGTKDGLTVPPGECDEFADARAIIAALQPGTGVFYAHVQPGTRPEREATE